MIAGIMINKKFQPVIKELFIRCRKLNISLVFITQSYFLILKVFRLYATHYLILKFSSKIELQNIAINHSADIDYKHFVKMHRECTRESFNILTIDSTLPASNSLRFRGLKYHLERKAAKTSLFSSNNLDKYEHLTGEDLGLKPSTAEQAKFEYSPLGKVFNKRLKEENKKKELLKRLKNI